MSMPASCCFRTTSSTPRAIASSNFAASYGSPRSWAKRKSTTSWLRGRLPTCVVRIRSVLVFIESPPGGSDDPALRLRRRQDLVGNLAELVERDESPLRDALLLHDLQHLHHRV